MTNLTSPHRGGSQVDQGWTRWGDRVKRMFRYSDGDAHDIVSDALLIVRAAHARKPNLNLGAVLQKAEDRRDYRFALARRARSRATSASAAIRPARSDSLAARSDSLAARSNSLAARSDSASVG